MRKKVEYRRTSNAKVVDVDEDDFFYPEATIDAALRAIQFLLTTPSELGKKKKKK